MVTKCINKNTLFYKNLVKQGYSGDDIAQITDKIEQEGFKNWYGDGKRDSFGNPVLINDFYIFNDKGERITLTDLLNDKTYEKRQFYSKDLTYLDKINHFLEEAKVGINKRISAFHGSDYAEKLNILLDNLNALEKNDYATALEKHSEYILKTIEDFETRLQRYDKTNATKLSKEEKAKNDKSYKNFLIHASNFLQTFSKIKDLEVPSNDQLKITDIIKKLKETENRVTDLQNRVNAEIESEVRKTLERLVENPAVREGIMDFLAAQVDESKVQMLLDALGDSHIPFLAAVDKFYKRNMYDKDEESRELIKEWKKFVEGFDNFDAFVDRVTEKIDGKRTGRFIQKYNEGFYEELYAHVNKLGELKKAGKQGTEEYRKALNDYFKWKNDNQEQQYVKSYYDSLNLLTPEAKEARKAIDEERTLILIKGVKNLTPQDSERLVELQTEMKWLKSKINRDGTPKTGKDLEIAESLYSASKELGKYYIVIGTDIKAFEKARLEAEEKGLDYLEKWEHYNTNEQYSDKFWKRFNEIISNFPNSKRLEEIRDEIKQLTIAYKNERGEVKVDEVPEDIKKQIDILQAEKKKIKSALNKGMNIKTRQYYANEFKALVEFVPSTQYLQALSRKTEELEQSRRDLKSGSISPAEALRIEKDYDKWMDKNHYVNEYSQETVPIDMWTIMRPRNPKFIERVPNKLWNISTIKEEYLNPNYELDFNGHPVPNSKWLNPDFSNLSDKDRTGLEYIQEKLAYLVEHSKSNIIKKGFLPAIPKDQRKFLQAVLDKEIAKEEIDLSEKAITEADEIVKFIPFKYVKKLNQTALPEITPDMDEAQIEKVKKEREQIAQKNKLSHGEAIDYDLAVTMQTFIKAALTNKYKTSMEADIKLFKEQLKHSKIKATDAKGSQIFDKIRSKVKGEKVEHEVSAVGSNMEKHFNEWLEAIFYEDFELDEGALTDWTKKIQNFTSFRALGFNVLSGLNNKLIANIQERIESAGRRYYSYRDYRSARRLYAANILTFINDNKSDKSSNFLSAYIKQFDVLISQDELASRKDGALKTALHKIKMVKDLAYFMQHIGEHQVQNATLIAMSQSHRVVDGKIMSFSEYYESKKLDVGSFKNTEEAIRAIDSNYTLKKTLTEEFEAYPTVMDSFEYKDGYIVPKGDSKVTKDEIFQFKQRVIGVNQRLHGIYNTEDAAMLQRHALGRLGMQFRKWMRPGWNRRFGIKFGKKVYNERIRDYEEGIYVTTFKYIANPFVTNYKEYKKQQQKAAILAFKTIVSGFKDLVFNARIRWHSMSELEKANVRKTGAEMLFLITVIALGFLVKNIRGEDDDDETLKDKMLILSLYQADRLFGELTTFTPIGVVREGNRLFSSPSPVFNTLEDISKLSTAILLYPFRDEEEREFKTGIYHGEDRVGIYAGDMVPVYNQVQRLKYMNESNERYGIFK